jgi:hypothetical protein
MPLMPRLDIKSGLPAMATTAGNWMGYGTANCVNASSPGRKRHAWATELTLVPGSGRYFFSG